MAEGVKRTPLLVELAVCSGLALVGMDALFLYSALGKGADPYGIEGERRSFLCLPDGTTCVAADRAYQAEPARNFYRRCLADIGISRVFVLAFVGVALS